MTLSDQKNHSGMKQIATEEKDDNVKNVSNDAVRMNVVSEDVWLVVLLEEEEVVGGGHSEDVLLRMPRGVQDLLVEVQAIN